MAALQFGWSTFEQREQDKCDARLKMENPKTRYEEGLEIARGMINKECAASSDPLQETKNTLMIEFFALRYAVEDTKFLPADTPFLHLIGPDVPLTQTIITMLQTSIFAQRQQYDIRIKAYNIVRRFYCIQKKTKPNEKYMIEKIRRDKHLLESLTQELLNQLEFASEENYKKHKTFWSLTEAGNHDSPM